MEAFSISEARTSPAPVSARRRKAGGTSRWASSPTTKECSTQRRPASIGSGEASSARAASFGASAQSRSIRSLRAERRHHLVEVFARGGDRLLRARHLEEVLAIARVDDRAEEHLLLLRCRR